MFRNNWNYGWRKPKKPKMKIIYDSISHFTYRILHKEYKLLSGKDFICLPILKINIILIYSTNLNLIFFHFVYILQDKFYSISVRNKLNQTKLPLICITIIHVLRVLHFFIDSREYLLGEPKIPRFVNSIKWKNSIQKWDRLEIVTSNDCNWSISNGHVKFDWPKIPRAKRALTLLVLLKNIYTMKYQTIIVNLW